MFDFCLLSVSTSSAYGRVQLWDFRLWLLDGTEWIWYFAWKLDRRLCWHPVRFLSPVIELLGKRPSLHEVGRAAQLGLCLCKSGGTILVSTLAWNCMIISAHRDQPKKSTRDSTWRVVSSAACALLYLYMWCSLYVAIKYRCKWTSKHNFWWNTADCIVETDDRLMTQRTF